MLYKFYYKTLYSCYRYANTLPVELVDAMITECFVDDSLIFMIIGKDEQTNTDILLFVGTRSEYDAKNEKQKIFEIGGL